MLLLYTSLYGENKMDLCSSGQMVQNSVGLSLYQP